MLEQYKLLQQQKNTEIRECNNSFKKQKAWRIGFKTGSKYHVILISYFFFKAIIYFQIVLDTFIARIRLSKAFYIELLSWEPPDQSILSIPIYSNQLFIMITPCGRSLSFIKLNCLIVNLTSAKEKLHKHLSFSLEIEIILALVIWRGKEDSQKY